MSVCRDHNKTLCEYAYGLRNAIKSDCLDIYLFGDVDPDTIATFIIHNNEVHNGWTYEQIGHLCRIMDTRKYLFGTVYNWRYIIKTVERKVDDYNAQKRIERGVQSPASEDDLPLNPSPPKLEPFYVNDGSAARKRNHEETSVEETITKSPEIQQIDLQVHLNSFQGTSNRQPAVDQLVKNEETVQVEQVETANTPARRSKRRRCNPKTEN